MLRQVTALQPKTGVSRNAPVPGWRGTDTAVVTDGCGSSRSSSSVSVSSVGVCPASGLWLHTDTLLREGLCRWPLETRGDGESDQTQILSFKHKVFFSFSDFWGGCGFGDSVCCGFWFGFALFCVAFCLFACFEFFCGVFVCLCVLIKKVLNCRSDANQVSNLPSCDLLSPVLLHASDLCIFWLWEGKNDNVTKTLLWVFFKCEKLPEIIILTTPFENQCFSCLCCSSGLSQ